jgi:hypothetical protein
VSQSEGKPFLNSLACHAKFPSNVGLGIPAGYQAIHDFTTFGCQPAGNLRVLDCICSDFLQMVEGRSIVGGLFVCHHVSSMTTGGCRVNPVLSYPLPGDQGMPKTH